MRTLFYPRDVYVSAVFAMACGWVAEPILTLFQPPGNPSTPVFWPLAPVPNCKGEPVISLQNSPKMGVNRQFQAKRTKHNKKLSWCWQTPAQRVYRSVKVTKRSTILYVRYSFLLCNSNFLFTIFEFKKCRDLEIGVNGHSRSLRVVSFDRLCMVSY